MVNSEVKVLIGDVQDLFREVMKAELTKDGYNIVADAVDGIEVLVQAVLLQPDIILMDLELPLLEGIKVAKALKKIDSKIKVIAITSFGDECLYSNLGYCIDGYIKKPVDIHCVGEIIYRTLKGEKVYVNSSKQKQGLGAHVCPYCSEDVVPGSGRKLTKQEMNIIRYIMLGMDNRKIAGQLFISINTVKFHVKNILRKYGVNNRQELLGKIE